VSSPGPPSSEASERKHSGEEDEEEDDEDEDEDEADDGCSDNLSYMDRVVMEVVESEAVYVRDLQQVVEVTLNAICSLVFIRIVTRFHHINLWKKREQKKGFFF
jgi:TATA-binding protein-associated factor Taf7